MCCVGGVGICWYHKFLLQGYKDMNCFTGIGVCIVNVCGSCLVLCGQTAFSLCHSVGGLVQFKSHNCLDTS